MVINPDLGDHTAEHELHVARHIVASILYVPRFSPARVMAVIGKMPRQASHPGPSSSLSLGVGLVIVKPAQRHTLTPLSGQKRPQWRLSLAERHSSTPVWDLVVNSCRVVRAVDTANGHLTTDLITKVEGNDGQVAFALQVGVHRNSRVVRIIDNTNGYHSLAGSQTYS